MRGVLAGFFVGLTILLSGTRALADVVDDAFQAGNHASALGEWVEAIESYREAERLLPGRSATLEYNLGTAHAQRGSLGLASFYLRRALQPGAGPTADLAETASRNLGIVRRRAELAATASGRQISAPEGWLSVLRSLLASLGAAAIAVSASWAFAVALAVRAWQRAGARDAGVAAIVATGAGALAVLVGVGHGLVVRADASSPVAVLAVDHAVVRAVPGAHGAAEFELQGGSTVRVVDQTPGWARVRLASGLTGWVLAGSIRQLDGSSPHG
ncbi:MAG: SH3 domain-containing protein [Nannocystaceae bacterium]